MPLHAYVYSKAAFFSMHGWEWNLFDTIVVCLQLLDKCIASLSATALEVDVGMLRIYICIHVYIYCLLFCESLYIYIFI